jgi:hypothetical protein
MREDAQRFFKPGFGANRGFECKAGFNPEQPRDDEGRWTDTGAGDGSEESLIELPPITVIADADLDSSFDADGDWLQVLFDDDDGGSQLFHLVSNVQNNDPPNIPSRRPPSRREVNAVLKAAARWIAKQAEVDGRVRALIALYSALSWLDTDRYLIDAYRDSPKTLDELREGAGQPKRGYDIHHIVEETSAEKEGYPRSLIDGPDNLVRIPRLKHWEITGWYATKNPDFGGLSPRDYLRGRSWEEKTKVGLEVLRRFGVLKP